MARNAPPARERLEQAAETIRRLNSAQGAARELGIPRKTLHYWIQNGPRWYPGLRIEQAEGRPTSPPSEPPSISLPTFPDDDIPAEQILDHMAARFIKAQEHQRALKWFEIKVAQTSPIGICWFGDPHLGNDGCNVPLLRRDIDIVKSTPGMYGANLGDTVDNWGGRLTRLYAESNVSRKTERALAKWFLQDSGVQWLLWVFGNHEEMDSSGAFTTYLRAINAAQIPMADWRARFKVVFPNGCEVKIDASHSFKGSSIWNNLHGAERTAMMEESAHALLCGHRHDWGIKIQELADGTVTTLAMARGYKWIDHFAVRHQFAQKESGAAIVTVLDPTAPSPTTLVRAFADVAEGAEFLGFLRKRAAA